VSRPTKRIRCQINNSGFPVQMPPSERMGLCLCLPRAAHNSLERRYTWVEPVAHSWLDALRMSHHSPTGNVGTQPSGSLDCRKSHKLKLNSKVLVLSTVQYCPPLSSSTFLTSFFDPILEQDRRSGADQLRRSIRDDMDSSQANILVGLLGFDSDRCSGARLRVDRKFTVK
jgi:hypothetical protein